MHVGKKNRAAQEQAFEAHGELVAALRVRDRVAYAYLLRKHLEFGVAICGAAAQRMNLP